MSAQLELILDDDYMGDLAGLSLDEVRSRRAECQAVETGLSYLRRLVQGRLDIVGVELQRRREGTPAADLAALVAELPVVLSDHTRPPGTGRLTMVDVPTVIDEGLQNRLDEIVGGHDVESLPGRTDEEVASLRDDLATFEQEVSALRRRLFERIDALQAEITRRYRTGEASVEELLQ